LLNLGENIIKNGLEKSLSMVYLSVELATLIKPSD
jgi:hypothetical protein